MYYLVQYNLYSVPNEENLILALERLGLDFQYFKYIPFENRLVISDFDTIPLDENVFLFGSVNSVQVASNVNYVVKTFFNDNHRYEVYSQYYKDNLLNYDSKIQRFSDRIDLDLFFCRPTEDTKTFKGRIYDRYEWNEFYQYMTKNGHTTTLNADTPIQVSSVKEIYQEIRCFIIGGKVITASYYRIGNQLVYKECVDGEIIDFANKMAAIFCLSDGFVMDIAVTANGLKIVECGCLNCAGFYKANLQTLLVAIEDYYSNVNQA